MRFEHRMRYDATPEEVFAMLGDATFRERVCEAQHATEATASVDRVDGATTVQVDQHRPADDIPSFARKFVGDSIHIRQHETWSDAAHAALEVTIPGKPGHLKGSVGLVRDGDGTVQTVQGDLKVSIPVVGGKIEALISELLTHALHAEQRVGRAWLEEKASR